MTAPGFQLGSYKGGLQFGTLQTTATPQLGGGVSLGTSSAAAVGGGGLQLGSTPRSTGLGSIPGGGLQLGMTQQTLALQQQQQQQQQQQRIGTGGGLQLGTTGGGLQSGLTGGGLQLGTTQQTSGGMLQLGGLTSSLAQQQQQQPLSLGQMKLPSYTAATSLNSGGGGLSSINTGLQAPGLKTSMTGLQSTAAPLPLMASMKPGGLPGYSFAGGGGGLKLPGAAIATATSGAAPSLTATTGLTGLKTGLTTQTGLKPAIGTTTTMASLTGGVGGGPGKKYTYKQLEQLVNKWSLELQEQEKVFLQQASQANKWDRMLAESGDKIADLSEEVDAVKKEQKSMESELDLIETQQKELDEMLSTMEKDIDQAPNTGGYQADIQRTRIFQMAEGVDSQLKKMAQDLKKIIEQMNEANRHQDEDSTFHQIVKILNAHTDSLGWIDRETALLKHKVEDVSKITEHRKREQERTFRLAFDN